MPRRPASSFASNADESPASSVETLWIVRRDGRSAHVEMCRNGESWEVRLFSDRHWFAAHRVRSRELALAFTDMIYDGLVAEGWVPESKAIHAPWVVQEIV